MSASCKVKTRGVENAESCAASSAAFSLKRKCNESEHATMSSLVTLLKIHSDTKDALYATKMALDAEKTEHTATKTEHVDAFTTRKNEHVTVVTKLNRSVTGLKKALPDVCDKLTTSEKLLKVSEENNKIHRQTIAADFHKMRVLRAAGVCNCCQKEKE